MYPQPQTVSAQPIVKVIPLYDRKTQFVPTDEIVLIRGDGNYTIFYCANGRKIMVSRTLRDYEKLFEETQSFYRIHKSYVVNIRYVQRYDVKGADCVWLSNGKVVGIARRRKHEFDRTMREYRMLV